MRCPTINRTALVILCSLLQTAVANAVPSGIEIDLRPGIPGSVSASSLAWGGKGVTRGRSTQAVLAPLSWTQGIDTSVPRYWDSLFGSTTLTPAGAFNLFAPGSTDDSPYLSFAPADVVIGSIGQTAQTASVAALYSSIEITYDPAARGLSGAPVIQRFHVDSSSLPAPLYSSAEAFSGTRAAADPGGTTRIYMHLAKSTNAYVAGESVSAGYENWIELDSADLAFGPGSQPSRYEALQWTQRFDGSVPHMLTRMVTGLAGEDAVVEFVKDAGAGPVTFMQLKLGNVLVSGLSLASDAGDLPEVSGTLEFLMYQRTIWAINEDGTRGDAFSVAFDVATGKPFEEGLKVPNVAVLGKGSLAPAVPEPATWMLLGGGWSLLVLATRRRTGSPRKPDAGAPRAFVEPV